MKAINVLYFHFDYIIIIFYIFFNYLFIAIISFLLY